MTQPATLTVDHLSVNYRDVKALRNINFFPWHRGQLVGIFGPNGAGKSTLVKAMLGLTPIVTGMVALRRSVSVAATRSHRLRPPAIPDRLDLPRHGVGCGTDGAYPQGRMVSVAVS